MVKLSTKSKKSGGESAGEKDGVPDERRERRERSRNRSSKFFAEKSDGQNNGELEDIAHGVSDNGSDSEAECDSSEHGAATVTLQCELPVAAPQLHRMLFTDCAFYHRFLQERKVLMQNKEEWQPSEVEGQKESRKMTYTVPVNSMGVKEVNVSEEQVLRSCSRTNRLYSIDASTNSFGAPYADSFTIRIHYCIRRRGDHACQLILLAHVEYVKSVWGMIKTLIEKQSVSGMHTMFDLIKRMVTEPCSDEDSTEPRSVRSGRDVTDDVVKHVRVRRRKKHVQQDVPRAPGGVSRWLVALVLLLLNLNLLLYWDLARSTQPCTCSHERFYSLLKTDPEMTYDGNGSSPPSEDIKRTLADIMQSDRVLNKLRDSRERGGGGAGDTRGEGARPGAEGDKPHTNDHCHGNT